MIFPDTSSSVTKTAYVYEMGLISETYKAAPLSTALSVTRDYGFLTGKDEYDRQLAEFLRNNGNNVRSTLASGDRGDSLVYWAEGASSDTLSQTIRFKQFNGFNSAWTTPSLDGSTDQITRYWNWVSLNSSSDVHFLLGLDGPYPIDSDSPTNQSFKSVAMNTLDVSTTTFTSSSYVNGGDELMYNVGEGSDGDFSVYRSAWRDDHGYIVRNDGTGSFFRLYSLYRTEGVTGNPLNLIRKLASIGGATKFEGQLINLSNGIYFFNNTGEFSVYNDNTNTWQVGGVGVNSPDFNTLQDTSVDDFDSPTNRLIATSDGDRKAYLFFDYSTRANLSFNETDYVFSTLSTRTSGEQFMAACY